MVVENVPGASTISSGILGFKFVARRTGKLDNDGISVITNATAVKGGPLFGKSFTQDLDTLSDDEEEDGTEISTSTASHSNEFVIQCQNDEMVFVTAEEGKRILRRCRPLRELIVECHQHEGSQILRQPLWTTSNVRRLIELLSVGRTWVENDVDVFGGFQKTSEELSLDIRLTSLINYQDTLSASQTRNFFELLNIEKYQFKLHAALKSEQWISLYNAGILLMSKSKLLSVRLGEGDNTELPTKERLDRCDSLPSDFCVYASGNMQAIFGIMNLLAPRTKSQTKSRQRLRKVEEAHIKIVCKIRLGSLRQADLAILWRMTDCSFTMSSVDDQLYLDSFQKESDAVPLEPPKEVNGGPSKREEDITEVSSSSSTSDPVYISSASIPTSNSSGDTVHVATMHSSDAGEEYICRTLSGKSFLALSHLMESINDKEPNLEACLVVRSPTPDTLGRLINASRKTSISRLDFELNNGVTTSGGATYFACKTTSEIKKMLAYMADYSSSAVAEGDFQLRQRTI